MTCSTDHRAALPRKENPGGEGRGFRKKERKLRFAGDSPLEEAVLSELVSEGKFPASWENTGNFVCLGLRVR